MLEMVHGSWVYSKSSDSQHRRRARTVQSYSTGGAHVYPHLVHGAHVCPPNGISIGSVVFRTFHGVTNTDRPTDRDRFIRQDNSTNAGWRCALKGEGSRDDARNNARCTQARKTWMDI